MNIQPTTLRFWHDYIYTREIPTRATVDLLLKLWRKYPGEGREKTSLKGNVSTYNIEK